MLMPGLVAQPPQRTLRRPTPTTRAPSSAGTLLVRRWTGAAAGLAVGTRVRAAGTVNVRSTPACAPIGTQTKTLDTISGGPQVATLSGTSAGSDVRQMRPDHTGDGR